ncbi:MAG: helix-hairpin-helix domain-containing protein, partial [Nevskiaceae bacterium]
AIGRGGQNVRLASELTGWVLNVMTAADAATRQQQESEGTLKLFMDQLGVDEEVATVLVQEGFGSLEEVAYVPAQELMQIEGFDEEIVEELRSRARDVLLTKAIAKAEHAGDAKPAEDLMAVEGMDFDLAQKLAEQGILTRDDLADLATDELLEKVTMDETKAATLIKAARAHWFAQA